MAPDVVDVETFIRNIEREFMNPVRGGLHATTRFRELLDWTSLQALIVLASIERDYGVTMPADEFDQAETVEDLYGRVIRRIGS